MQQIQLVYCTCALLAASAGVAGATRNGATGSNAPAESTVRASSGMNTATGHLQYVPALSLYRRQDLTVKSGDSLSTLFHRTGLARDQWVTVLALGDIVSPLRHMQSGDTLRLRKTRDNRLQTLDFSVDPLNMLHIERRADGLHATMIRHHPTVRTVRLSGSIRHSLSASLATAGASPAIAAQMAHIFRWRLDLSRQLRPGDHFAVLYMQRFIEGHRLPDGPVQAAELDAGGHQLSAFRHIGTDGHMGYFDRRGRAYALSIERTPLSYTRVSSPFSLHRMDPVRHIVRPHYGVDLAAPRGTPVHAAAGGVVTFRGRDGGYGRLIKVNHAKDYQTRYAHLSAFAAELHNGQHVQQDEIIGYVGASGEATGPHLHYEIRHDGKPHDPLHMTLPGAPRLAGPAFKRYRREIVPLMAQLDGSAEPPPATTLAAYPAAAGLCLPNPLDDAGSLDTMDTTNAFLTQLLCPVNNS